MSTYLIFFGKSQDFTTCYYDRDSPIHDFNTVIKDFDLLESKIFTVDDLKNKEILSRYFFTAQRKSYCLLKLYSFAQAFSGNRIAGSIYGVGILCDKAIDFSKKNTELLRVAKDNFAKLSLDGAKFKKSNFKEETDRIWKAIVLNSDGNLFDKIATSPLKINKSESQVSYFVKDLFSDAIKLNDRISNLDAVYFSEDLEHLKRTQNKWGKETFPIYWEQNNQFVSYKETVVDQKSKSVHNVPGNDYSKSQDTNLSKLRADLSEYQFINQNHQHVLKKLKGRALNTQNDELKVLAPSKIDGLCSDKFGYNTYAILSLLFAGDGKTIKNSDDNVEKALDLFLQTFFGDDVFVVDELNSTYTIKDSEFLKLLTDTDSDGYGNSHSGRGEYFASSKLDDYKKTYEDFEDYQGTNEERSDLHIELLKRITNLTKFGWWEDTTNGKVVYCGFNGNERENVSWEHIKNSTQTYGAIRANETNSSDGAKTKSFKKESDYYQYILEQQSSPKVVRKYKTDFERQLVELQLQQIINYFKSENR